MELKERKINSLEKTIENLRVHIEKLEKIIKEDMEDLNNNIQSVNLKDADSKNWNYFKRFQEIQTTLTQLENEKGQFEALTNLYK